VIEREKYRPFTGDAETSAGSNAEPLALVLCQVRWPLLAQMQTEQQLRGLTHQFGPAVGEYPLVSETKNVNFVVTPDGVTRTEAGSVYQWASLDEVWHASLSRQFLSLYTTGYAGFGDMVPRLRSALVALRDVARVPVLDRVGFRYVDRLTEAADIDALGDLVKPEILGYQALNLPYLADSINQATYHVDSAVLRARSGMLPDNETPDPAIRPVSGRSWVLDLDASQEGRLPMDVEAVIALASRMSDLAYDYFKTNVTEAWRLRFPVRVQDGSTS
jgi:uncharacterized protein (TIGR04255 family)